MIGFFCFTKDVKITHRESGGIYQHLFLGVQDTSQISFDRIYFSTPSDFYAHITRLKSQYGEKADEMVFAIDPKSIANLPQDIGFGNLEEKLTPFKGKPEVKIAIVNAMSNAVGDHLIGMQAFDYWHKKVSQFLEGSKITITFFQLDPRCVVDITKQWSDKLDHLYQLPSDASKLINQDAFIDLGTLLLRQGFDTEHMVDFYLKALSIDCKTVPDECKRMKYSISEEALTPIKKMMNTVKTKADRCYCFTINRQHQSENWKMPELEKFYLRSLRSLIIL